MPRYLFLTFLSILCAAPSFAQDSVKYYDEYGLVAEVSGDMKTAVFHSLKGKTYKVKLRRVEYDGGMDSLTTDIYSHVVVGFECNARVIAFVLFDRAMNIREIRCSPLPNHEVAVIPCLHEYIDAISKTGKRWKRKGKRHKYELAIFSLKIH